MALVNADYAHLEWDTAVFQSKDKVAYEELWNKFDIHSDNQKRLGLPTRLVAKTFLFRICFGGSAFAFATDPEFTHVSRSDKYWQRAIDTFYAKYTGLRDWHSSLMDQVVRNNGRITIPSGREYVFEREYSKGERSYPRTKVLNYPVQGLGADIMMLARVIACNRVAKKVPDALFIGTVHDSVLFDCPKKDVDKVARILYNTWDELPKYFESTFGVPYDLPCGVEVQSGPNWGEMEDINREDIDANSNQ